MLKPALIPSESHPPPLRQNDPRHKSNPNDYFRARELARKAEEHRIDLVEYVHVLAPELLE